MGSEYGEEVKAPESQGVEAGVEEVESPPGGSDAHARAHAALLGGL